ncbi:MAG TPA: NAD(P)H-dependent oxidoreductase [Caldilineaceae bacterium]|nr:NAD(P)H-dependent oxidoreductase [Caldilineaceae bacterium]
MKVLTVIANPNSHSFCHALLERFTAGLKDGGHTSEVVDLYAIHFNPVFETRDFPSYIHESMPLDVLEQMNLKQQLLDSSGGPIRRFMANRWLRNKDLPELAKFIHEHRPKDVIEQWEKVRQAQGLHLTHLLAGLSRDFEGLV